MPKRMVFKQKGDKSFSPIYTHIIISIIISKPSTNEKHTGGGGGGCRPAATRELFICNGFADDDTDDDMGIYR